MPFCYNLISCDESLYPSILGVVSDTTLASEDSFVKIDGEAEYKVYLVKRQHQSFFRPPDNVSFVGDPLGEFQSSPTNTIEYTVNSLIFNGTEYITGTTPTLSYLPSEIDLVTISPNVFAPASYTSDSYTGLTNQASNNLSEFLNSLFNTYGIPVISKPISKDLSTSFTTGGLNDEFVSLLTSKGDELIVDITRINNGVSVKDYIWAIYDSGFSATEDIDASSNDTVGFNSTSPAYVFIGNERYYEIDSVPALLNANGCIVPCTAFIQDLIIPEDCTCTSITINDTSTYLTSLTGHDSWGYRRIEVIRPDGAKYIFSSESAESPDSVITPYDGVNPDTFIYTYSNTDEDGVYDVRIFAFPDWDATVSYTTLFGYIVYLNGRLYKIKANNVGVDPSIDTSETYWEEYEISDETLITRYGFSKKIVTLCIELEQCKERLLQSAFCSVESSPCGNLCKNDSFQKAMKYIVVMEAISISKCKYDWSSVAKQVDILKSICSCGGC